MVDPRGDKGRETTELIWRPRPYLFLSPSFYRIVSFYVCVVVCLYLLACMSVLMGSIFFVPRLFNDVAPKAQCVLKRVTLWVSFITTILILLVMGNSFTLVLPYTSLSALFHELEVPCSYYFWQTLLLFYIVAQGCCFYGDAPPATLACS